MCGFMYLCCCDLRQRCGVCVPSGAMRRGGRLLPGVSGPRPVTLFLLLFNLFFFAYVFSHAVRCCCVMEGLRFCGAYLLGRLNGESCPVRATLVLKEVPGGVEVVAGVANTLRGVVALGDGKLRGVLTSATVMGSKEQIEIERALVSGFEGGLGVQVADDILTLAGRQHSFVFTPDLTVERLVGKYALCAFDGEPVAHDDVVLVIIPGSKGCVSVIARFSNSLRGELRLEEGRLRGAIALTLNASEGRMREMEQRFDAGMERGMEVSVSGRRLTLKDDLGVFSYLRLLLPGDLAGDYVLKSLNGFPVRSDGQITLALSRETGEDCVGVVARVSSVLRGKAKLARDTLQGELTSEKMPGSDAEMLVEDALTSGFETGFSCVADAGQLTLRCGADTLVYTKAAVVPYENGQPAYLGENVARCLKGHGNGLLFRIINANEGKWAFYNDTTRYNMRVVVYFGSRSKIKSLGSTRLTLSEDGRYVAEVSVAPGATEMFIAGHVNGYTCAYDALPL